MTWQGGKAPRDPAVATPFAPLRPLLAGHRQDAEEALQNLAHAVRDVDARVQLQVRLLEGDDIEHWDVKGGRAARAARRAGPKSADVIVIMRRETWLQIAQGRLAPFDALFAGRLRVGGDVEAAKRLVQQMSDPSVPFVPPC
jgi:putative sterol carrier protein